MCDDRKDDWWLQFKGKTLGPRPELVKEFVTAGGKDLHMYSSDRFLEFAGEHFGRAVSVVAVAEMRELKKFDEDRRKRLLEYNRRRRDFEARASRLDAERYELENQIHRIESQRSLIEHGRQALMMRVNTEDPAAVSQSDYEKLEVMSAKSAELEYQTHHLRDRMLTLQGEREVINSLFSQARSQQGDGLNE